MNIINTQNGMRAGIQRFAYAVIGLFGFAVALMIVFTSFINGIKPFLLYLQLATQSLHEESGAAMAGVLGYILLILLGIWIGKRSARLMSGWTWHIEVNGRKSYFFPFKIPVFTIVIVMLVSIIANFFLAGS